MDDALQEQLDTAIRHFDDTLRNGIWLQRANGEYAAIPRDAWNTLTAVGVAFTSEQRQEIEALVAAGDIKAAQDIILRALGKE